MKIDANNLQGAVSAVAKLAMRGRTTLPILHCLRIEADGKRFTVTATDLDCTVTAHAECSGKLDAVCVRAARLAPLVAGATGDVTFKLAKKLTVEAGAKCADIATNDAAEFPPTAFDGLKPVTLDCGKLGEAIERVSYALSTDPTRYVLNGVCVESRDATVHVVTTDSRRLAEAHFDGEMPHPIIIPSASISDVVRALRSDGAQLLVSERHMAVRHATGEVTSKLVEGVYPNWRQVIPTGGKVRFAVDAAALAQAVNEAIPFTTDKAASVKLVFSKSSVRITAGDGTDSYADELPGAFQPLTICMDPKYLVQALRSMDGETQVTAQDELSALKLTRDGTLAVIMPMRMS